MDDSKIEKLSLVKPAKGKPNNVSAQFGRYLAAALVGYCFDFGTLILLHGILHVNYLLATTCGFIFGLVVIYILSDMYVFGKSKIKSRTTEFGLFTLIGVIGLGILDLLMWIFTGKLGVNYILSKIIATVFVYAWNFLARRSLYHS
jgi:putative flippase GtrA